MGDILRQFGMGDSRFIFASYPELWQDKLDPERFDDSSFGSVMLPGMDGVFPTNPFSRGRTSSNTIRLQMHYTGDATTDFTALKKALHQLKNHGLTYLFKTLEDNTLVFTLAACTRVHVDSANDNLAYVWPRGEMTFFCPKARWYGKDGLEFLDNGDALDDGLTLLGPQIDRVTVDSGDTVQLTNNGDAPAGVLIWAEAPTGESVTDFSLSRMSVDGVSLADRITYNATLSSGDVFIADCRNHQAQLNYSVLPASGYGNIDALRATWMELPPGESELIVGGTFTNGAILSLEWYDTWY